MAELFGLPLSFTDIDPLNPLGDGFDVTGAGADRTGNGNDPLDTIFFDPNDFRTDPDAPPPVREARFLFLSLLNEDSGWLPLIGGPDIFGIG